MERNGVEREIAAKAREWVAEYGEDFLVELIEVFLEEAPLQLAELRRAAAGKDAGAVGRQAHSLKSSSANLGAATLSAAAQKIEAASRGGATDHLTAEVDQLATVFAEVRRVLEKMRSAPEDYWRSER